LAGPRELTNTGGRPMDESATVKYISETFEGVEVTAASGDYYFFYDPTRMFPFATLVTGDRHDQVSDLDRPGVFRLNIGVSKQTFQSLFSSSSGVDHDFTALDRIMPHPVYGKMYWVCVLNPSPETFETVRPLLAEAYELSVQKQAKKRSADES
jgi:hypothetical protein